MKITFVKTLAIAISLFFGMQVFAQNADAVLGTWLVPEKDAKIEIYKDKARGKYCGKVVWTSTKRTDEHNPNPDLRSRDVVGVVLFDNFYYKDGEYLGTLYSTRDGKTYSGFMRLKEDGTLFMKGYIMGMRFLGKSNVWTRVKE
jgi:uncharacterized protein (DUF2147 family)